MRFFRGLIIALLLSLVFWAALFATIKALADDGVHPNLIRWCPEDAVPVGIGDFDGQRWDRYHCIALDDLTRNDDDWR